MDLLSKKTGKNPNIIVADLKSTRELLRIQEEIENPFIAYVDEFISSKEDAEVMADICFLLPKQSVLLSSVLPKVEHMPTIVDHFCRKYNTTIAEACKRVSSYNVNIPCAIINTKTRELRFPHHYISTKEELSLLVANLQKNPRIRRAYPANYVYFWSQYLQEEKKILPPDLYFDNCFENIGSIKQGVVSDYVIKLLQYLLNSFEEGASFDKMLRLYKEYSPVKLDEEIHFDSRVFTEDTHKLDCNNGITLFTMNSPLQETLQLTENTLFKNRVKIDSLLKECHQKEKLLQKQIQTKKNSKTSSSKEFDKRLNESEIDELLTEKQNIRLSIPNEMILNTKEHFFKFVKGSSSFTSTDTSLLPKTIQKSSNTISVDENFISNFSDEEIYLTLSKIGVYDYNLQTKHQRELIMSLYKEYLFFAASKDIIYGTNLDSLCNIILTDSFCENLSECEAYQLSGRVGRTGSSNHANIYVESDESAKFLLKIGDNHEKENEVEKIFSLKYNQNL